MDDTHAGVYVLHVLLLFSWLVQDAADSGLGLKTHAHSLDYYKIWVVA